MLKRRLPRSGKDVSTQLPTEISSAPNNEDTDTVRLSRLQKIKDIYGVAREDFYRTTWKGKITLGSLMVMGAYEWGPGNETVTPIIAGRVLDVANGIGGVALTAAVGGGFVAGQQLAASYLARKTAAEFPTVSDHFYQNIGREKESGDVKFRSFDDLSYRRKFLYSTGLGSSFNVLREAAVTEELNQNRLKRVGRTSSLIAGITVATVSGGVDVINQHFSDSEPVQSVIDWSVKNPAFWLGVMGVMWASDYYKSKRSTAKAAR